MDDEQGTPPGQRGDGGPPPTPPTAPDTAAAARSSQPTWVLPVIAALSTVIIVCLLLLGWWLLSGRPQSLSSDAGQQNAHSGGQSGQSGAIAAPPPGYGCDPLVEEIDALLTEVELRAAETSPLVAGAEEVITRWVTEGRPVAVVTNNSPACVGRLAQRCLPALAQVPVVGRDPQHPDHAKPDPWGIHRALSLLDPDLLGPDLLGPELVGPDAPIDPGSALMVGDSLSDVEAARAAGCGFLGMGSTPAKRARLAAAVSSGAVVADFHELRMRLG